MGLNKPLGIILVFPLVLLSAAVSHAGNESSGGGDRTGLTAAGALKLVPSKLRQLGSDLVTTDELKRIEEIANSDTTLIMMTDEKQVATAAGISQSGTAFSASGKQFRVSLIYRGDWEEMKGDHALQIAFMTHEACVLAGIEQTGAYGRVSAAMLNRLRSDHSLDLGSEEKDALSVITATTQLMKRSIEVYLDTGPSGYLRESEGIKTNCDFLRYIEKQIQLIENKAEKCYSFSEIVPLTRILRIQFPDADSIDRLCVQKYESPGSVLPLLKKLIAVRGAADDLIVAGRGAMGW